MTPTPRRSLLGLLFGVSTFGCGGTRSQSALSAPVTRPPALQIPVDLDVVVRLDVGRLRRKLETEAAEALARLLVSPAGDPGDLLVTALTHSEQMWVGFRPDLDPRYWDNVVVLVGDFSSIPTATISQVWGPSRDLGGGYKSYDVTHPSARSAPARLYTLNEERWLLASEAEIDALERSIERGRAEREDEPPARGLLSVTARLGRIAEVAGERGVARAFEKARGLEAWFDLSDGRITVSTSIRFLEADDATLARRALSLVFGVALPKDISWEAETAGVLLTVEASAPLELLLAAL